MRLRPVKIHYWFFITLQFRKKSYRYILINLLHDSCASSDIWQIGNKNHLIVIKKIVTHKEKVKENYVRKCNSIESMTENYCFPAKLMWSVINFRVYNATKIGTFLVVVAKSCTKCTLAYIRANVFYYLINAN